MAGATIGIGESLLRPNMTCSRSACSSLGGHARRRAGALDVDDHERQLDHQREAEGLLLSAMPGPDEAVRPIAPPYAAPIAGPMAAISSSAWNVLTPKFL